MKVLKLVKKRMLRSRRAKANRSKIKGIDLEDHRSGNQMLKGTLLSMVIVMHTISLVIRLLNEGAEKIKMFHHSLVSVSLTIK